MDYIVYSISFIILIVIFFTLKLKKILNPISVFCFSFLLADISVLICENLDLLRGLLSKDTKNAIEIYNYSIFTFIFPWLIFSTKNNKTKIFVLFANNDKFIANWLSYVLLFSILITVGYLGGVPIFKMLSGETNINEHNQLIESLPFGILAIVLNVSIILAIYLSSILFNRKKYNAKPIYLLLWTTIFFISSIWQGKRQGLLIFVFFTIARFSQNIRTKSFKIQINKKFFKRSILYITLAFIFIYIFLNISNVRNEGENTLNNELLQYTMFPPMNMSKIIDNNEYYGSTVFPNYILTEILPSRFTKDNSLELKKNLFEPTSPSGYLSFWYLDYGIYGVIIGSFLLSISSLYLYKRRDLSEKDMRYYIFILWCCATVSTYSHFISLNFFLLPFILMKFLDRIKFAA